MGKFITYIFKQFSNLKFSFAILTNQEIILSRIREMPVSARPIERRVRDIAENITVKQAIALQKAASF